MIYVVLSVISVITLYAMCRGLSGFHLLAYGGTSSTATVAPIDLSAFVDGEFSTRNGHYLLSEQYYILGISQYGTNVTESSMLSPTLNSVGKFVIWPLNDSSISAVPPRMDFFTHSPIPLPMNEEIQVQVLDSTADTITTFVLLGTQGWNRQIPQGIPPVPVFPIRFSCTPTFTVGSWSTLVNPAFEQSLRGGTYAVVGVEMQGTGLIAARMVFPQAMIYQGRRLRPGFLASQAIGDLTVAVGDIGPQFLGTWGQFTTAELPFIEACGIGSTTAACQGVMRLVRLSESINVNYGGNTYK